MHLCIFFLLYISGLSQKQNMTNHELLILLVSSIIFEGAITFLHTHHPTNRKTEIESQMTDKPCKTYSRSYFVTCAGSVFIPLSDP